MRVTFYDSGYGTLGVQYMMSCLAQAGHEADLFFDNSMAMDHLAEGTPIGKLFSLSIDQVIEGILDTKPDMVGFSTPTYFYKRHLYLAERLKKEKPDLIICMGGTHATLVPETCVCKPQVDFAVVGEGEYAFPKLVTDIERYGVRTVKGMTKEEQQGCWSMSNGEIINRGLAPTAKNLDEVPFPEKRLHYAANPAVRPIYTMLASRGCVFTCTFCNSASLNEKFREEGNSKFYRYRSVDNVIKELKWAREQYNFKYVTFFDDIFAVKRSWLAEFNEKYKAEIGLPFEAITNPKIHNVESMQLLADSGCVHIEFGFQSASPEVRREMLSRKETNEEVRDLIHAARSMGILMELDLIVNLPGETEKEVQADIEFVQEVHPEIVNVSFLQYFPKTPIIQTAIKHGLLKQEDIDQINSGEMVSSMRVVADPKLSERYRILPFQMYFAAHWPRPLANLMMAFIGLPLLRRFFSRFGTTFLYMTRIWIGQTDRRDFFHRRQIPRTLYAARDVFLYKYWRKSRRRDIIAPAPADTVGIKK